MALEPEDTRKKYDFYVREFLNPEGHHSIAFLYAYVATEGYGETELTIGDCNRTISLSMYEDADLVKLDRLLTGLKDYRKAFVKWLKWRKEQDK